MISPMMPFCYRLLAEGTLVLHLLWIGFLILGGYIFLAYPWLRVTHFIFLLSTFGMQIFSIACPLTYLEDYLRLKVGLGTYYQGSFIYYYLEKLVYPGIPPGVITLLTGLLMLSLIALYFIKPIRFSGSEK